ncbi:MULTISPECIES: DUF4198 domain-containing protein [Pseudoxanthomonas]|uniref:GH25 family protein n=1 Tax=Pseudoxanthomonas winnipegensis TaxID=2480810 RepID=A0AAW8GE99_9GAMM|nr:MULTISPECIES: DUF4198 domain-containing protein [Pseudoxanthomonas]MDQ1120749.1 putative GH25 family protein [Pseudoxanthomonas winnipegensis]MDQ1133974.1 putative GH25 family protein [Pseudoxanthomonas winnipegensis]MDR6139792.1 putative GH25 family protein [Pseudoxanthomonas sp. SORGH_AS_0997]
MKTSAGLLALLLCLGAARAAAHTPYLAPSTFSPQPGQTIAVDAAFAEMFFVPEAAFDQTTLSVTSPDGSVAPFERTVTMKTRVAAEHTLPKISGTYRLDSGLRHGATFRVWEVDGKQESSRDAQAPIPAGAKVLSNFQALTRAEAYVTVKALDRRVLAARGQGLEFVVSTHPNDLYVGESFAFSVHYDGKPLAHQAIEVTEAVWTSDREPEVVTLTSDAQGRVVLPLKRAGTWVALARHRTPAPAGAPVAEYSNSYTLTFRVLNP